MKLVDIPKDVHCLGLKREIPVSKVEDLTGQKFNQFWVVGLAGLLRQKVVWLCKCKCGKQQILPVNDIRKRKSCKGCAIKRKSNFIVVDTLPDGSKKWSNFR